MDYEACRLVRFYVGGSTTQGDKLQRADGYATATFGGFTRIHGVGGWKPLDGGVVWEEATIWEIYPPKNYNEEEEVMGFALFLKELFQQEAVLVSVMNARATLV